MSPFYFETYPEKLIFCWKLEIMENFHQKLKIS